MKSRGNSDVALRGPWLSGGIEFNFGIIGHSPSTSTPIDWFTRENGDGSVSCFVASVTAAMRCTCSGCIALVSMRARMSL